MQDVKALENCVSMAAEVGTESYNIRPCIAIIWFEGVTNQRGDYLHVLATECKITYGFDQDKVIDVLNRWNSETLAEPKPQNEVFSQVKGAFKPRQFKTYGCTHLLIMPYCIGPACPWHKEGKAGALTLQEFVSKGWLKSKLLTSTGIRVYMSLIQLFYKKGKPKNNIVHFTFAELEKESGIYRKSHRILLEKLKEVGLLKELWINQNKGTVTRALFSLPIPYPIKKSKKPITTTSFIKVVNLGEQKLLTQVNRK